jgi:hypothetical protein
MYPTLIQFAIAIIGAGLAVGLFTIFNQNRLKEGKVAANSIVQFVIILGIIAFFVGYLIS